MHWLGCRYNEMIWKPDNPGNVGAIVLRTAGHSDVAIAIDSPACEILREEHELTLKLHKLASGRFTLQSGVKYTVTLPSGVVEDYSCE